MSVKDLPDMQIQRLNSKQECNLRKQDKHEHVRMNTVHSTMPAPTQAIHPCRPPYPQPNPLMSHAEPQMAINPLLPSRPPPKPTAISYPPQCSNLQPDTASGKLENTFFYFFNFFTKKLK